MKRIIAASALLFLSCGAFAQTSITVRVENVVAVDEQFNVSFIVDGENSPSSFDWTPGDDFQLVWGPQKGMSSSVTIVNGNRTKVSQVSYTYVLLPKRTGKFELPAASATVKGKLITSRRATVEVVSSNQGTSRSGTSASGNQYGQNGQNDQGGQNGQGGGTQAQRGTVSGEDLYMKLIFSKSTAMVGESVTATLKLYQRVNIAGFEDARFPSFTGFWSQEQQAPTDIVFQRENVNGMIYNTAVLRSWRLIPQQSGDIRIEPSELVCLVNVRTPKASTGSIFDSFFQEDYQTIRKRIKSEEMTLHIQPLPSGAPDSFGGGVGKFTMSVSLSKDSLKTHDAASLKVTVTGTGNTSLLDAPKITLPPDFELYDTKTTDVQGGKCFEFPFIPRSAGEFSIEPVKYSYYDISAKKYVTLESGPFPIKVEKGNDSFASESGGTLVQGVNRKDVRDLGSDIRFISTKLPSFTQADRFFIGSPLFIVIFILMAVIAAVLYFTFRKVAAMRADVAGSKNRSATKMARKRLSRAESYLEDNLYTAFYEELHKTLLGFASDKLTMDASEMTKENIAARFIERLVSESLATEFVSLLDACEFARYSPDSGHVAMKSHFDSAVTVISSIDESMKKKTRNSHGTAVALLLLLLFPVGLKSAEHTSADSLWNAGVNAYSQGQWEEATESWNAILGMGLDSPELQCNLGNAWFKAGDLAKAILGYERALMLDPSCSDAEFNLKFARNQVQDKIEEIPDTFLQMVWDKISGLLSSDMWAILALVLFAVTLAALLTFLLSGTSSRRKAGFITGICGFVLLTLSLCFSFGQKNDCLNDDAAIVVSAVTSVKSSPDSGNGKDLFILHEGTKVTILDEVGIWRNIQLADGRQGWLKSTDIEII